MDDKTSSEINSDSVDQGSVAASGVSVSEQLAEFNDSGSMDNESTVAFDVSVSEQLAEFNDSTVEVSTNNGDKLAENDTTDNVIIDGKTSIITDENGKNIISNNDDLKAETLSESSDGKDLDPESDEKNKACRAVLKGLELIENITTNNPNIPESTVKDEVATLQEVVTPQETVEDEVATLQEVVTPQETVEDEVATPQEVVTPQETVEDEVATPENTVEGDTLVESVSEKVDWTVKVNESKFDFQYDCSVLVGSSVLAVAMILKFKEKFGNCSSKKD